MNDEGGGHLRPHRSFRGHSRLANALRPVLLILLVGAALTSAAAVPRPAPPSTPSPNARTVVVHGRVRGLFPGARKQMRVVLRNTTPETVRLTGITAVVANASPTCRARNVSVRGFVGSRTIPALASIRVPLRSRMRPKAPNACQGARFPVRFTATLATA